MTTQPKTVPVPHRLPAVLLALVAALPAAAQPSAEEWQRCRAVADATERLACYDAMADTRGAQGRAVPAAATAPGPAPAAAPTAAPATAADAVADFGLPVSTRSVPAITSSLPGFFPGWEPRARLRLANGQVWQVTDGSKAVLYLQDPKVRVRRGALGSFFLEIEGTNVSPRVRRVE